MPTIWGDVAALVNEKHVDASIVIKVKTAICGELRICATVEAETLIARGTQPIALEEITVGEFVELTYLSEPEGPIAKTVYVRPGPIALSGDACSDPLGGRSVDFTGEAESKN